MGTPFSHPRWRIRDTAVQRSNPRKTFHRHMVDVVLIYFSLNEWQTRNDTLHNDRIKSEREEWRNLLKAKIRIMYRVHRGAKSEALRRYYNIPYLEMITIETDRMEYWMITVTALYKEEAKTDRSIRRILDRAMVDINDINLPPTHSISFF